MQPFRPIGETVNVTSGANAAVVVNSSVVWVTNQSASTWAEYSTQVVSGTPDAGGVPIPPNQGILIAISGNAKFYAAAGGALSVTPVEMLRSQ